MSEKPKNEPTFRIGDELLLQPRGVDNMDTYGDFRFTPVKIIAMWFNDMGCGALQTDKGDLACVFDVEDANGQQHYSLEIQPAGRFIGPFLRMP